MKMEHKPVLKHPYIVFRTLDNKSGKFDIWSEPKELFGINHNDLNRIREIRNAFKNPKPKTAENFGFSEIKLKIDINDKEYGQYLTLDFQFPTERTQIKLCLPAGTILETFNI
jgi:hypothetical protein